MTRWFVWGDALPEPHEMLDHFERHGELVRAVLFGGGDGLMRGAAEVRPPAVSGSNEVE